MKKVILSRCGYRCDLCLAYKDNIAKHDQRVLLSDTWFKIYGFRIPAEDIYCDGCLADCNSTTCRLIDADCPIRSCVITKGLENCSQCDEYMCEKFRQRMVIPEQLLKNNPDITRREYTIGIKPYENKNRIDWLREKHKVSPRLLNPEIEPNHESISRFIDEQKAVSAWHYLNDFMENNLKVKSKITFNGKKYGWIVQFRQGKKTIATFFPKRNTFTVLVVLGRHELDLFKHKEHLFSKEIVQCVLQTKSFNNKKWLWIRIKNGKLIPAIKKLIQLKHQTATKKKI